MPTGSDDPELLGRDLPGCNIMCPKILLSSFAAITIALVGAVSAQNAAISGDGNEPFSAADPVPNAEAQTKTETMLREEEKKMLQGN
jgi:hypothetical protein